MLKWFACVICRCENSINRIKISGVCPIRRQKYLVFGSKGNSTISRILSLMGWVIDGLMLVLNLARRVKLEL